MAYTSPPAPVPDRPSPRHVVVRRPAGAATQPENVMAAKKATRKAGAAKKATAPTARKAARRKGGTTAVPGISRIDQASTRTHGYFVRVGYHRTKEGAWRPKFRSFFGDAGHGGKEKAFKAAVKWLKDTTKK